MKWIKRFCWLAAWGVWLWLGFGHYRELPRDVGAVVCKLPFEPGVEHVIGFMKGDDLLLSESIRLAYGGNRDFNIWEIKNCRKHQTLTGPTMWAPGKTSVYHGVAVGEARGDDETPPTSMRSLDLRTGEWKKLGPSTWGLLGIHPTRPWAAFSVRGDRPKFLLVDFRTGERIFEWTGSSESGRRCFLTECQFLDDPDEFLLSASDPQSVLIHISRTRGELARMTVDRSRFSATGPMRNGRVALLGAVGVEGIVEVVEFPSGRTLFSSASLPGDVKAATKDDWNSPAKLSQSGRGLFTWGSKLWSVDDGRLLWQPSSINVGSTRDPPPDFFVVVENWTRLIGRFGFSWNWTTTAVRDMENGDVLYRYWGFENLHCVSGDGRFAVDSDGTVYQMPLRVNWWLLAICQAVLASPLVLLWLGLRWRRRRIARRLTDRAPAP